MKHFSNRSGDAKPESGFLHPDAFYAPHTFWFWNGAFRTGHIRSQAAGMCEQNLNPGYVHARFWPTPPLDFWMSEKWVDLFKNALEETERQGMHLTYTVGDPCFPDKYLLPKHPELAARSLEWTVSECRGRAPFVLPDGFLFAVAAKRNEEGTLLSATFVRTVPGWTPPDDDPWSVYAFKIYTDVPTQYRNSYLDHRLFDAWKEVEHNLYEEKVSPYFGNVMRGVFVDQEGDWGYKMAWSEDLAEIFRSRAGYDIALALPLLIEEDAEGLWCKARWEWFDALSHCYMEAFAKPMTDWCAERGMYMTCHYWEGDLYQQAMQVGSYFLMQRASSMPGTDCLFRHVQTRPELFGETASVCEFEKRPNLSEILGIAGWDLTPGELKDSAGAAVAWGITQPVIHGINTNPDIDRVSYPPDFYQWNPYWSMFHLWTGFAQRASYVNDHGRLDAHVLILCPMDSVWALTGGRTLFAREFEHKGEYRACNSLETEPHGAEIREIDRVYQRIQVDLRRRQIDFMIADKHYFEGMTLKESSLAYGDFTFDTVILPPLKLLPLPVAWKLLDFARAGGMVIALGSLPDSSAEHGENDPEILGIFREIKATGNLSAANAEQLAEMLPRGVIFDRDASGILTTRRMIDGRLFVWISNNSGKPFAARMTVPGASGAAEYWNCETGSKLPVHTEDSPEGAVYKLNLGEHEGFWLAFDPSHPAVPAKTAPAKRELLDLSHDWTLFLDTEKQVETGRGFLMLPDGIMSGLRLPDLVPWQDLNMKYFSGVIDYIKEFELDSVSGTETLRLEQVYHTAAVFVNGDRAGERMWGPFEFEIGPWLKPGKNRIVISVGNLILNEILSYPHYNWKWPKIGDEKLISGIAGSVKLCR